MLAEVVVVQMVHHLLLDQVVQVVVEQVEPFHKETVMQLQEPLIQAEVVVDIHPNQLLEIVEQAVAVLLLLDTP